MANKKIMDHMAGSNDFTLLKVNHAEYYSLEPCGVLLLKRPALVGDRGLLDAVTRRSRIPGCLSMRIPSSRTSQLLHVPSG